MKALGSTESLLEALREEVEEELAKIRTELDSEIGRQRRASEADPVALPDRETRLESARHDASEESSRQDWADRRAALEDREAWIVRVVSESGAQFVGSDDRAERRELLARWIGEGVEHLSEGVLEAVLSAEDAALFAEAPLQARAARATPRELRIVSAAALPRGSCVVRTVDGRASFDNGLAARSRRFESVWRSALAEIYGS
jgi:vacuolar-type H+-ATPase subunit E/Vma4